MTIISAEEREKRRRQRSMRGTVEHRAEEDLVNVRLRERVLTA